MSRAVIINADDFGLSPAVNRGIVEAFRDGILTSTTMLVNLEFFDDAVRLARENPDLPVGVHLSLLWGPPVSDPAAVPTLVDGAGQFPRSLGQLASRYFLRRLSPAELRGELSAQVRKFLDAGLTPTHVDTHKHVHCLPGVLDAVIAVADELEIRRVRLPLEDRPTAVPGGDAPSRTAATKRRLIRLFCRGARQKLERAGVRTTDHFAGIEQQSCLNSEVLRSILSNLREGVTELMCHPGHMDDPARRYSAIPPHREVELESLKDPRVRAAVEAGSIRLMHYGDL